MRINTPQQIVEGDCKEYEANEWKISVAQVEELGLDSFWERKDEVQEALNQLCLSRKLDFSALLITDISRHFSLLLTAGNDRIAQAIAYPKKGPCLYELDGIVSRKKQLLPHLMWILERLSRS